MKIIQRASSLELAAPGEYRVAWYPGKREDATKKTARMTCPDCGRGVSLSDHDIDTAGVVSPSVVCPHPGCEFRDRVALACWIA